MILLLLALKLNQALSSTSDYWFWTIRLIRFSSINLRLTKLTHPPTHFLVTFNFTWCFSLKLQSGCFWFELFRYGTIWLGLNHLKRSREMFVHRFDSMKDSLRSQLVQLWVVLIQIVVVSLWDSLRFQLVKLWFVLIQIVVVSYDHVESLEFDSLVGIEHFFFRLSGINSIGFVRGRDVFTLFSCLIRCVVWLEDAINVTLHLFNVVWFIQVKHVWFLWVINQFLCTLLNLSFTQFTEILDILVCWE